MSTSTTGCGCGGSTTSFKGSGATRSAIALPGSCSCGGNCGGACSSGCGCGGTGCAACEPRSYVRPRFFPGQLLTDGDLGLLEEYMVAKNRLHNRALQGQGVVCGLDVQCDPCGGGKVVIQPGYAINCCGDDIVVPCPEEVDLVALVRDLKAHSLGAECADPCDQPKPTSTMPQPGSTQPGDVTRAPPFVPNPQAPVRRYYLYLRYTEQLTDPVSPYASDEPCAGQACEPTRVREGHVYELRCTNDSPPWVGVGDRFLACIEDIKAAIEAAAAVQVSGRLGLQLEVAQRALQTNPTPRFLSGDFQALRDANSTLRAALQALPGAPTTGTPATAETTRVAVTPPPSAATADQVHAVVEGLRLVGSLLARWTLTPPADRPPPDPSLEQARPLLKDAQELVPRALESAGLAPLDAAYSQATLQLAEASVTPAPQPSYSQLLFAYGAPLTPTLYAALQTSHTAVAAFLAARRLETRQLSDCELERALRGLRSLETGALDARLVAQATFQLQLLRQILLRFIYHCLCSALNPPCQSCDDPAVLLAAVCMQDCVVTDVCELERRFVITWPNVRYWLHFSVSPFDIDAIGQGIGRLCCMVSALGSGCTSKDPGSPGMGRLEAAGSAVDVAGLALGNLFAQKGPENAQLAQLFSLVQPIVTMAPASIPAAPTANVPDVELQRRIDDAVRAAMANTNQELTLLRAEVDRLRGANG
jgi:hypothetical protein